MTNEATTGRFTTEQELREAAVRRLKAKRDLGAHVMAYVLVNAFIITIWAVTSAGFFWPIFPLAGWGIGIAFHAWDVYAPPATPARIEAEMDRLRR